jgi:hypothetical protein
LEIDINDSAAVTIDMSEISTKWPR